MVEKTTPSTSEGTNSPGTFGVTGILVLVSALAGLLIAGAAQVAGPIVAENQAKRMEAAVLNAVPGGVTSRNIAILDGQLAVDPAAGQGGEQFFGVYDAQGAMVGLAFEACGHAWHGPVRVIFGYDPQRQQITGLSILESRETPGLGEQIKTDPAFLENFKALDATVDPETNAPTHPIVAVRHGAKTQPWEIDGVSGATVSSRAVATMLDETLHRLLPQVRPHLDAIRKVTP